MEDPATSRKVLVLHSGGMDSTVCLLLARELGCAPVSLGIDYGQRHSIELMYAARQCQRLGVERRLCHVRWDKPSGRTIPTNRSIEDMPKSISPAFLPGRNIVFLALGVAEAVGLGAREVWFGANSVDFSGYPDCRTEFVDAFRHAIQQGVPMAPTLVTPLQQMSKAQIASEAARLGLRKDDTWSCYRPSDEHGTPRPCGTCDACILHNTAWQVVTNHVASNPST